MDALTKFKAEKDLEPVWMTRGQLREIVERLLIAEGMKIEQAKIHADMRVSAYLSKLRLTSNL